MRVPESDENKSLVAGGVAVEITRSSLQEGRDCHGDGGPGFGGSCARGERVSRSRGKKEEEKREAKNRTKWIWLVRTVSGSRLTTTRD